MAQASAEPARTAVATENPLKRPLKTCRQPHHQSKTFHSDDDDDGDIHRTSPISNFPAHTFAMRLTPQSGFLASFQSLRISPRTPTALPRIPQSTPLRLNPSRTFTTTRPTQGSWIEPSYIERFKVPKGRPRVRTGGSTKGTTVVYGDYGLRMIDKQRRMSQKQLKNAMDTIKTRLRGTKCRIYTRVTVNTPVCTSGNDMRMGKGKGSFDHWASRIAVNRIIFELKGMVHERVARDAFRLAGIKLPGIYEFVMKGDPPVTGTTKMVEGVTLEGLKRPWKENPEPVKNTTAPTPPTPRAGSSPLVRAPPPS